MRPSHFRWDHQELQNYRTRGREAFARGAYAEAASHFAAGAAEAAKWRDDLSASRFLSNQGAALITTGEYRAALQILLTARTTAERAHDLSTAQTVEGNLVTLYGIFGDREAGYVAARRGVDIQPADQSEAHRIETLLLFGRGLARWNGLVEAEPLFREALRLAAGNWPSEATVLESWAYEFRRAGNWSEAQHFVERAWRSRTLGSDRRRPQTELLLASILRLRGELARARFWYDRASQAIAGGAPVPVTQWSLLTEKALLEEAEGNTGDALATMRAALESARAWRERLPPSDRLRLATDANLQELLDGYLRIATRRWAASGSRALAAETFSVVQDSRSWTLRESAATPEAEPLLAKARRLEAAWLGGDTAAKEKLSVIRTAILEKEAARPGGGGDFGKTRTGPAPGTAVLTFWLGEERSLLWAWTASGLRTIELPSRGRISEAAASFRDLVARANPEAQHKGEILADLLFGALRQELLRYQRWEIVADETLSLVPIAALPGRTGRYLVEDIETRFIPSAWSEALPRRNARGFVGFADPVFNLADPRRTRPGRSVQTAHWAYELPRIPATATEAEAAAQAWRAAGAAARVITGLAATEESVLSQLRSGDAAVLHIATHTAAPATEEARPRLALSLREDGSPGLLTAADIGSVRCNAEVVVMSACHSAGATLQRGTGLIGLTRAWMSAGARQVVSTLWPISEDTAFFYSAFHRELAAAPANASAAARALRAAQLRCLREGGNRALPAYWAAHFVFERK